jgi:hypothetical protein
VWTGTAFTRTERSDAHNYRLVGSYVDVSAPLIGARGILTIGMRGAQGLAGDRLRSAAARSRLCGGTGAYQSMAGRGRRRSADIFLLAGAPTLPTSIESALLCVLCVRCRRVHF